MHPTRTLPCFALLASLAAACSPPAPSPDAGDMGTPADATDATPPSDGTTDAPPADSPMPPACGDGRPTADTLSMISGSEGLVIAADGTIYFSQPGAVGRLQPGMAPELNWVAVGAAGGTIWGLALDPPRHQLYVGAPEARAVFAIDISMSAPMATTLVSNAGTPNGLTLGPDGALYYSDFNGGHVYRVDPATMMRTRVTTSVIPGANGVAFAADGSLYVDAYMTGSLVKLTLSGNMEAMRQTVAMSLGAPDGLAFDAMGRIYVTDNMGGRLIRMDADGTNRMVLHTGIAAAANIEFGAGALRCTDIYVASGDVLYRYEMGDTAGAMVPWHR